MYAVIATGGKQYRVQNGDVIYVEKLDVEEGQEITFDTLMYYDDETLKIGSPLLSDFVVKGRVLGHGRGKKIVVFKYKAKKNYRRKKGHRQPYTKVEIVPLG